MDLFLKRVLPCLLIGLPLFIGYAACGFSGSVSIGDLGAISGTTQVSIGICAAYLAFDRFRFHNRFMHIAERITLGNARGLDLILTSQRDNQLNADEIGLLSVYYLAGDRDVQDFLKGRPKDLEESEFLKSFTGWCLVAMLKIQLDRLLVMVLVSVLCCWDLYSSILQLTDSKVTEWLPSAKIICPAIIATAMGSLLPAVFFAGSKLVFISVESYMKKRFKSIAVNMERIASQVPTPSAVASVPPNNPPETA